ncbi:MAG: DMT family transporter [Planctomycetota bacterium]|jgi:drug/metabolite transporter (DMT)-like permease
MSRLEHKTKGATLIFVACGFFCIAGSLIKYGSYIGTYKLAFFRFVIGLCLIATAAMTGRVKLVFNNKKLLFLRGLAGGTAVSIGILSITKLGLGKGMVLVSSYPIFASIFSAIFLKERLRVLNFTAILTALVGIYFIAYNKGQDFTLLVFGKYELLAVFGAVIAGIAINLIRKLHDTDDSLAIYFSQCVVGMWLVVIPAFKSDIVVGLEAVFILLGMGVSITVGQLLMTQGMKYVPVKIGSLLLLLDPVLCFIAGVVIFSEPLTLFCLLGSVLVVGSCAIVLVGRKT